MLRSLRLATGFLALVVLALVIAEPAAASQSSGLSARVDADGFFAKTERPLVTVTLTNHGTSDVYVVRWQTPLAGVAADLFDVRRDGQPVAYIGRLAKFVQPRPQDYLRIAAGASRSVTVDLAELYDLDRTGEYSVQLRMTLDGALRDAKAARLGDGVAVASNVARMAIERDAALGDIAEQLSRPAPAKATNSYVSCSSTRQSSLATARTGAASYASGALGYLQAHTYSNVGPRYTTWFGSSTSSRFSTVTSHYTNIKSALSNASYTFDCTCTDSGTYAYVYPTQPYRVYLCGAFWSAPTTGTDSKAGTLVHETSHFNVVASTNDNAYGQTACKKLALKSPTKAIDNADSHEYFAENNPAQN